MAPSHRGGASKAPQGAGSWRRGADTGCCCNRQYCDVNNSDNYCEEDAAAQALGHVGHDDADEEDDGLQPAVAQDDGEDEEADAQEDGHARDEVDEVLDLDVDGRAADFELRRQRGDATHHRPVAGADHDAVSRT
ncbi:hypothetical protein EYF80_065436 [Liparis tanakae]|uniref:Uncharacterized protein n=1 Tax=Liparis tanakae TaxID=230148 RepID=A0A4Z2E6L4_9TELE|nr:hypothetical protein EYF80_065436 [Liparis tanakae]